MTSVPSASDIAPARHEKWELEKAPILFSVSSIRRISVRRKRDWHVVVLAVLDFEHHFDERVERILLQPFEVGCHVIRQAVDALVVGCAFLQEILHAAVLVGQSFLQQRLGLSVGLKMRQTDFHSRRRLPLQNVQDVAGKLVTLFLCKARQAPHHHT